MWVQKVHSRKESIYNVLKKNKDQEFFTTFSTWETYRPHRLLILDSSFNPPTKAHANLLTKALASKPANYFDASLLLFSMNNVDKELTGASALQRAQMMELMSHSFDHPVAVGFTTHGKFVDKAKAIQAWFERPVELHFILGYDTITRLFDPKYYTPIPVQEALASFFQSCYIICADRGEADQTFWNQIHQPIERIQLDADLGFISSTLVRQTKDQDKLKSMLDPNILQFIQDENLYSV
ncbi:hypothetical protein INT48_001495 [Thamnidium elegans]|uniref:Nicotinamide-nucleotide adenylyltransferase n=1 Tax=Thamnidium elegans TaxID=101142 RepID=A0A8H7VQD3_9FUNG|nr:hypothetical protein INT48_001495 [Thamnidium elegans]